MKGKFIFYWFIFIFLFFVLPPAVVYPASLTIYQFEFQDADLVNGYLTIVHGLGINFQILQVYNNNNKIIMPSEIERISLNTVELDLKSYQPIAGTWHVFLFGGD